MTAPTAAAECPPVDWRAVLAAGMSAVYGVAVTVSYAAPITCTTWECVCPDGHLWVSPVRSAEAVTP